MRSIRIVLPVAVLAVSALTIAGFASSPERAAVAATRARYFDLTIRVDTAANAIIGRSVVTYALGADAARSLNLTLDPAYTVDSVRVSARASSGVLSPPAARVGVTVARDSNHLSVRPMQTWPASGVIDVMIAYHGAPTGNTIVFTPVNGAKMLTSWGMPYSAGDWWPSIDLPSQKGDSADITIIAPAGMLAASNGVQRSVASNADGTLTTHWAVRYPIYPDVISIAVGNYVSFALPFQSITGKSMPMTFFAYPQDEANARADFSVLPKILAYYETLYGEYPYIREKYGVAEFPIQSFREHQTIPSLGAPLITGDHRNDPILAHELAHQWFGNALTVRNWRDVWMNEGFAQYSAMLWMQHTRGDSVYTASAAARMKAPFTGSLRLADSMDVSSMFGPLTFQKGPLVLHMLRHVVGDAAFFGALRDYIAANKYGLVDEASFRSAVEHRYGKKLDWFFDEWVDGSVIPSYKITWTQKRRGDGFDVDVAIEQTQADGVIRMPMDVSLTGGSRTSLQSVLDTARVQHAVLMSKDSVTDVVLDPKWWVIRR